MHILITGANGFVGKALTRYILEQNSLNSESFNRLSLLDLEFDQEVKGWGAADQRVHLYTGSFATTSLLADAGEPEGFDYVFHLASIPSGLSERRHELGLEANVYGMLKLLKLLKEQDNQPVLVFASSIAAFGKPTADAVTEDTIPTPNLSYGYQKLIGENLLGDYLHKGWIRACSLRLPGIVARPPVDNGAGSIFFSDIIRKLLAGKAVSCPVGPDATSWLMSIQCCIQNLLHGAALCKANSISHLSSTFTLPPIYTSIQQLVDAIASYSGNTATRDLIHYKPDEWTVSNFGSYPPISCPRALEAGFKSDPDLITLVANAIYDGAG